MIIEVVYDLGKMGFGNTQIPGSRFRVTDLHSVRTSRRKAGGQRFGSAVECLPSRHRALV